MFVLNPKQVNEICDEILKAGYGDKLNFGPMQELILLMTMRC